jgi:hypothetical protein
VSIGNSRDICRNGTNTLTGNPSGGTGIWKNLTPSTVTVDGSGNVTGISVGAAAIRYIHTDANGCTDSTDVSFTVHELPAAPAANPVTVCYDGLPHEAGATANSDEEIVWYDAPSNGNVLPAVPSLTDVGTLTVYAAAINADGCESATRTEVSVTINPKPDYPDVRVEVCAGSSDINLSKYIDTVGSPALVWTGLSIDPSTGVISSIPSSGGTYTYIYSITSACLAVPDVGKVYLHTVKNSRIFFPRDTIAVCYEKAEALQMNQIFGVEAEGTWNTNTTPDLMNNPAYIRQSTAPSPYAGAVVFNGKAAYGAGVLTPITYQGKPAEAIEFYYTVDAGCLQGVYKVVIVLYSE